MRLSGTWVLAFGLIINPFVCASAIGAIVPDDFPTIQSAIDSGAEEILVRPGVYAERPLVARPVVIRGLVTVDFPDLPMVHGVTLDDSLQESSHSAEVVFSKLHITGPVINIFRFDPYSGPLTLAFEDCVLDSGISDEHATARGQLRWLITRCKVEGGITLTLPPQDADIVANEILGTVLVRADEKLQVVNNRIVALSDGSRLDLYSGGDCRFQGNTVSRFVLGVQAGASDDMTIEGNVVEHCASGGIFVGSSEWAYATANTVRSCGIGISGQSLNWRLERNLVEDCGAGLTPYGAEMVTATANVVRRSGNGMRISSSSSADLRGNRVEHCRGIGIEAVGTDYAIVQGDTVVDGGGGISVSGPGAQEVLDCRVVSCGGPGVMAHSDGAGLVRAIGNVVGRCEDEGIVATGNGEIQVQENTSYLNGRAGFLVGADMGAGVGSADHNLSYRNRGAGLALTGNSPLALSCNDWFADEGGRTSGLLPDSSDRDVDPRLCDPGSDDVHLSSDSPLADARGCGLIGALGIGCDASTATLLSLFTAEWLREGISVSWKVSTGAALDLERSQQRAGPWTPVRADLQAEGSVLDGSVSQDRDYWYRLSIRDAAGAQALGEPIMISGTGRGGFSFGRLSPNPASGPLRIEFVAAVPAHLELDLLDVQGRTVASLARGWQGAGRHTIEWSARGIHPGLYLVRYRFPGGELTRRITIFR